MSTNSALCFSIIRYLSCISGLIVLALYCQLPAFCLTKSAEISKSSDNSTASDGFKSLQLHGPILSHPEQTRLEHHIENGILRLHKGSRFAVLLLTPVNSTFSKVGDRVNAMVLSGLELHDRTILPAGAYIRGWVSSVNSSRSVLKSKFSSTRWRNSHASVSIHFSELVLDNKMILSISAKPARQTMVTANSSEFALKVNDVNEIELDFSGAKYGATGVAIQAASWATGPFKFVVAPILSGATGLVEPAYALDRPVNDVESSRMQGLVQGIVKGLPGGGVVLGAKHKGVGVELAIGDQLQVELSEDLTLF